MEEKREEGQERPLEVNTDYLSEQIKQRPLNKRKFLRQIGVTVFLAVLFCVIATVGFLALYPALSRWMNPPEEPQPILFPEETEEILPEDMPIEDEDVTPAAASADSAETQEEAGEETPSDIPEEDEPEEAGLSEEELEEAVLAVLEKNPADSKSYATIFASLRERAAEAEAAIVTVAGISEERDWFDDPYEKGGMVSGVIIAHTDDEVLVLVQDSVLKTAERVRITFVNGEQVNARIRGRDEAAGFAVLSVSRTALSEEAIESIRVANLGASGSSDLIGKPVIAVGAPAGEEGSVLYGIITGNRQRIDVLDGSYKRILTNIYTSTAASGVLLDLSGHIVGIIDMSHNDSKAPNLLCGVGISELRSTIQLLSNSVEKPLFGIYATDVTPDIGEEMDVPVGVYVLSAEKDTPAMDAGVQSGDVIVEFNAREVDSFASLIRVLSETEKGSTVPLRLMRMGADGYQEIRTEVTLEN